MKTVVRQFLFLVILLCCIPAVEGAKEAGESTGAQTLDGADETMTNSLGMKLKLIKPGTFVMGSEKGDADEKPVREVTITKPFYIGVYEVTQAQYDAVMGSNPSHFRGADRPVESVSWHDAVAFCKKLSEIEKNEYRLPTEAEWEYACRAGSTTEYYWGDQVDAEYCWYEANSNNTTHDVGGKKPNTWGLYDMSGNVWEWCGDWHSDMYRLTDRRDPIGPSSGAYRVNRGGSWDYYAGDLRSANRLSNSPNIRLLNLGFRVVAVGWTQ